MILYEARCVFNGKRYFGVTCRALDKRIYYHVYAARQGSRTIFHKALRKFGADGFSWRVVGECCEKNEIMNAEKAAIELFGTNNALYGYNGTAGGEGTAGTKPWNHGLKWPRQMIERFKRSHAGMHSKAKHPRWIDFDLNEMMRLKNSGMSYSEIGTLFGVDKQVIYKRFRDLRKGTVAA